MVQFRKPSIHLSNLPSFSSSLLWCSRSMVMGWWYLCVSFHSMRSCLMRWRQHAQPRREQRRGFLRLHDLWGCRSLWVVARHPPEHPSRWHHFHGCERAVKGCHYGKTFCRNRCTRRACRGCGESGSDV